MRAGVFSGLVLSLSLAALASAGAFAQGVKRTPLDVRKLVIERPVKTLLRGTHQISMPVPPETPQPAVRGDYGAKVTPGLVKWHPNFADACKAAKLSGKPVLLFQMMGNLDDEFC